MNELLGALLMGGAVLWIALKILRVDDSDRVSFGMSEVAALAACWLVGRVLAGMSLLDLLTVNG